MLQSNDPNGRSVYRSRRFGRSEERSDRLRTVLLLVVGALVVGFGWFAWTRAGSGDGSAPASDRAAADTSTDQGGPTLGRAVGDTVMGSLPPLDESDPLVRRLAEGISARPRLASWFVTDDLVRRFVVAVTHVAHGRSPEQQVDFMDVEGDFQVRSEEGRTFVDPVSYQRYDDLVEAFVSLDPAGSVALYRRLRPLFGEAYRELGLEGEGFDPVLARAVENLLAVRLPSPPVEVQPQQAVYGYVDPELEASTPAAKHLMRMGPENARRVQEKLRELADALGLDVSGAGAGEER